MTVLVTGVAGFIGHYVALALLDRGEQVLGIDNLNDYYDVRLKQARLKRLEGRNGFTFQMLDIADHRAVLALKDRFADLDRIVHLAAQAGVRYSLVNPFAYMDSNGTGHLAVLELARALPRCRHMVYASSSSVYGANSKLPFSIEDRTDAPVSLYGATKKATELMSRSYAHLFRLKLTGLRFFTVYGPWGRPDMAAFLFADRILKGEPIPVFGQGEMKRDFTYIDDIVAGILAALDRPPADNGPEDPPHRVYNLGNHRSEKLLRFIDILERELGTKAKLDLQPMQPGDVRETYADIEASRRDLGFEPGTPIDVGIPRFVAWYKSYHGVAAR
ncbi:MAG: NAD-dependent epimerase/dehydratase family protein [Alphaproteobacteria bacterium]|nr:NAD-dependent epimerase/dehydratase family protein [Alphaproteobacteria bacterium]